MDGDKNTQGSGGDGATSLADGGAGAPRVDGDGAGSIGAGSAGSDVSAGGDAGGGDQPAAATPPGRIVDDGTDDIVLDWKGNESDAEAAITWARYHASDQPGKAIRILRTLAESQELQIRNGDTPVRNNAKTALRDVLAQVG